MAILSRAFADSDSCHLPRGWWMIGHPVGFSVIPKVCFLLKSRKNRWFGILLRSILNMLSLHAGKSATSVLGTETACHLFLLVNALSISLWLVILLDTNLAPRGVQDLRSLNYWW